MMYLTKRKLPRRTLLRGAGVAIGLPLLDAMLPAATAEPPPVRRLGFVMYPLGVDQARWKPKGEGAPKGERAEVKGVDDKVGHAI